MTSNTIDTQFTSQEDQLLLKLFRKYPFKWQRISLAFKKTKKSQSVIQRYMNLNHIERQKSRRIWSAQEDKDLLRFINQLSFKWSDIAKKFQSCTPNDCYTRYKKIGYKKIDFQWSFQEDSKLIKLFQQHHGNWRLIQAQMPNHSSNCQIRYNQLQTAYLAKFWQPKQQKQLMILYEKYKKNWDTISKNLKLFSARQCFFKYHRLNQQKRWTFEEDDQLKDYANKYNKQWILVSQSFNDKVSAQQCKTRYQKLDKMAKICKKRIWNEEQDKILMVLFQMNPYQWQSISNELKCSPQQCYQRCRYLYYSYLSHLQISNINQNVEKAQQLVNQVKPKIKQQDKQIKIQRNKQQEVIINNQVEKTQTNERVYEKIKQTLLEQLELLISYIFSRE